MKDHVHILIGYQPAQPLPDLVRDIKANSSRFINEKKWLPGKFRWQEGYGAFSYSNSQLNDVIHYINSQEELHRKTSFKDEYLKFLEKYFYEHAVPKVLGKFNNIILSCITAIFLLLSDQKRNGAA